MKNDSDKSTLRLATFSDDITPPVGHPLCAGWYPAAIGIADPLFAKGVVLHGDEQPIVLCALDWAELSNRSYAAWRQKLAEAVGTIPGRVAVHCMHPHMTPWPDEYAQQLAEKQEGDFNIMDTQWCADALERVAQSARQAMKSLQPVTHLEAGRAQVEKIASNRRIMGEDGKIKAVRWTKTLDPAVRAEPEGLIDPWLKTVSFWSEKTKLAALHYYAVHPTSYEDAFVTPEFTGLARERRQSEDNHVPHLYFTECAGNITAGKYNDGATENREIFTERIHRAMAESEQNTQKISTENLEWRTTEIILSPRPDMNEADLLDVLRDTELSSSARCRAAIMLAYLERMSTPIEISALHFGDAVSLLHLPGESFMEYQIFAQQQRPNALVAVPSYGDCGPGYICMESSFGEGGYEPVDSFVSGECEATMKAAITKVMQ
jgi:hypothetical protein